MIKRVVYVFVLCVLASCGGSDDSAADIMLNAPTLVEPTNQFICLDHENIDFEWTSISNADTYRLEISKSADFSSIANRASNIDTNKTSLSLQRGITYYWRVKAVANAVESNYSEVFQFYTQGEAVTNQLPKTPVLLSPDNNATFSDTPLNLSWFSSDKDTSDTLLFDVYLGTAKDTMSLVSENQLAMQYNTDNLTKGQTYYWRVAVKDNAGGIAISSISSFSIEN